MTEGEQRPGLRPRIAMAIAATCFASILVVVTYLYWALENAAVAQWQQERRADSATLALGFDRTIKEMIGDLRLGAAIPAMASLPDVNRVVPALNGLPLGVDVEKRRVLDAIIDDGAFSVAFILQPNGDHYISHPYEVQKNLRRFNLADRPYFKEATRTRQPVLSDAFIGADGVPGVAIDIPRLNDAGEIVLHLGGVIHLPRLTELFTMTISTAYDVGLLVDRHGEPIAKSRNMEATGLSPEPLAVALRLYQAERPEAGQVAVRFYHDHDNNEDVLATFVVLPSGWAIAMARGRSTFITEIRPELTRISLMVGFLLFVMGAIGFVIASHIAGRWEDSQRALAAAHDELEDRVRQRTADLDRSRHDLQLKSTTLETILENISHGISLYDADLNLVTYNRRFIELLNLPPEMIRPGISLADYLRFNAERGEYGPGDVEAIVAERMALARDFQPFRTQRVGSGGTNLEVVGTPLPGGGLVATHTDITEAKRAEEALRTLSRAVEQSPVSVIITDPDGNIEYVNPKFVAVTGYTLDEARGKNPRVLKSGLTQDDTYRNLWRTISSGGTWEGDIQNRKKNGELFWESATISPIRAPDGAVIHFLAVKEDISARKQAEADLLAAWQAAEEANRSKTVFLSHMSHELRTPLTAVLGYAEMMDVEIAGPLSPVYADYVDSIVTSGHHLLSIIDEVLDISRIELGSYRTATDIVNLGVIAAECVAMIRPQCAAKGIDIVISPAPTVELDSDGRALRQILINLLGNAVKYTQRGRVTLAIAPAPDGGGIVTISDTGCGIPAEKLDRIFEPFQQVDPLRADPARGVGLGLAICRRIVDLLGGTIVIRSQYGQGSTVTVTLPARLESPCLDKDGEGESQRSVVC
ncbi:MAG: PAS-domain containing protein [Phaeospirillum sp.]|nr:PAS-domain containing protein [Phaeospirillum sp.]